MPSLTTEKPTALGIEAVQAIVMKVLSIDDLGSKCVIALTEQAKGQENFRDICKSHFDTTQRARSIKLTELENRMNQAIEKNDRKEMDRISTELETFISDIGVKSIIRESSGL